MTYQYREDCISRQDSYEIMSRPGGQVKGCERTLLWRSLKEGPVAMRSTAFDHACPALVFAVPPAAGRQSRFGPRRKSQERRGKRQTEDGQQRDDDELTQ